MRLIALFALLALLAYSVSAGYGPPPSDHDNPQVVLDVSLNSTCEGNIVTVKAGDELIPDAHVSVMNVETANTFAWGDTDANGQFPFEGCDLKVDVKATHNEYLPSIITKNLVQCAQCEPVPCECGEVQNNQCIEYTCCMDADCGANQVCTNHSCVQTPQEGCSTDADCKSIEYCDKPPSQNTGSCKEVLAGDCGQIVNHTFIQYGYECGTETGCPSCAEGNCLEHKCIKNEVTCPPGGIVGDDITCGATENGQPCANCDYVVTHSGKNYTGKTDENGNFHLQLNNEGIYGVGLLKNGTIMKTIEVTAKPKGQPIEPEKPSAAGSDMLPLIGVVALIVLLVLAIIYWRGRASKK